MRLYRNLEPFFKILGVISALFLIIMVASFGTRKDVGSTSTHPRSQLDAIKRKTAGVANGDRSGRTIHGTNFITFYNAIPKTGSRSLDSAIIKTAVKHPGLLTFQLIPPTAFDNEELLNTFVTSMEISSFVRGHAMYKEFRGGPDVVYINVVRDPVERVISNYYFDVYGDEGSNATHGEENWPETIDDCVKMPSHQCNTAIKYYAGVTLRQFCGMDERCKVVNRWTFNRAKRNLQHYTIVGLSSEMDTMIRAIEILLPDMFGGLGLYQQYSRQQKVSMAHTKTTHKHSPRAETIKLLRRQMDLQYEFFNHINVRYNKIKSDLNIE